MRLQVRTLSNTNFFFFFIEFSFILSIIILSHVAVFVFNITINIFLSYNNDHLSYNIAQAALKHLSIIKCINTISY